jgi:hypothetical protein
MTKNTKIISVLCAAFKEAELIALKQTFYKCLNSYNRISTNLYLPPIGTAGFGSRFVNGYNLEPCPPPKIIAITFFL